MADVIGRLAFPSVTVVFIPVDYYKCHNNCIKYLRVQVMPEFLVMMGLFLGVLSSSLLLLFAVLRLLLVVIVVFVSNFLF